MNSFVIKIISMITMLIDHTIKLMRVKDLPLIALGRVAFPLFAFQATIGYKNTKNIKKYLTRLMFFAIISEIPFFLYTFFVLGARELSLNVIFTIFFGVLCMYIYDIKIDSKLDKKQKIICNIMKIIMILILVACAEYIKTDYGAFGVLLILFIHIFYNMNKKIWFVLGYIVLIGIEFTRSYFYDYSLKYYIAALIGGLIPVIFMLLYNGKKGKNIKYLVYAFYPIHLFILVLINFVFLR